MTTRPVRSTGPTPEGNPGCEYGHDPQPRVRAAAPSRERVNPNPNLMANCYRLEPREMSPPGQAGNGMGSA
ncbi:hypothetical protein EOD39_11248 [Acipenser ruthenus]|uniref:Uncharacterized protein n=1 Tax=Acipenser ruthenus TaxID=7906 RepID=A0A444UPG3_ACIRT|nr:hypothetical protein EOD39_11248 [Acipenser ruthenus]